MVSTFTPNISLEEPARGDQVGTWDTPVNANMTLIDLVVGGAATIALAGAPVVLAAAQFQAKTIVFSSTLTANVAITFPTSFTKSYEILNQTTGSSNFIITLQSTAAAGAVIGVPPGEMVEVANIAGSFVYKNLGRVGSYWDHGGSSVPHWVSGCTIPPYLQCDGTAFSSATYPHLRNFLGSATLPDSKGRTRYTIDGGTNRISVIAGNNTVGTGGGDQALQTHTHTGTTGDANADHTHSYNAPNSVPGQTGGGAFAGTTGGTATQTGGISAQHQHAFTTGAAGTGASQNMPPLYIGGITLIRAG